MGLFAILESEVMKVEVTAGTAVTSPELLVKWSYTNGIEEVAAVTSSDLLDVSATSSLVMRIDDEGECNGNSHYLYRLALGFGGDAALPVHQRCAALEYIDAKGRFTQRGFDYWWAQKSISCT